MSAFSGPSTGEQFTAGGDNASVTDAFCSDTNNVVRPALSFQAHVAPLDIKFYDGIQGNEKEFGINQDWAGDAFVCRYRIRWQTRISYFHLCGSKEGRWYIAFQMRREEQGFEREVNCRIDAGAENRGMVSMTPILGYKDQV